MASKIADILQRVPVFSNLTADELEEIGRITLFRRYRRGMIVFMEGEPGDGLYFVQQGKLKLMKLLDDGRETILHFLQDGDIFAEVLLFDGGPYPATAEVIEDAEIGIIRNQDIEPVLKMNPGITMKILRVMAKRLRQAQLHVRDLALKDTYGRLATMLLKLADEFGEQAETGVRIKLTLSQQELANLIGSSRETVARILGDFKKGKAITIDRQQIVIQDVQMLKSWI